MDSRHYLRVALSIVALLVVGVAVGQAKQANSEEAMTRINVTVGDAVLPAMLDSTPAARDFASMLPLEMTLTDFNETEKVADLGRQLDDTDAPRAYTPKPGDITQYRPWGNLAIFYKPFQASVGLLRLGEFEGSIEPLMQDGDLSVRIELAD